MGSLGDLKARISRDLARPDFPPDSQDIADAINTAIAQYANERFRFSDSSATGPLTFLTEIGRYIYTSADNANIGTLEKIDYVLIQIGNIFQGLSRVSAEDVILYNQNPPSMMGQPSSYAYRGNQLMLAAVPSDVWLMSLGVFLNLPAPTKDEDDTSPWTNEAELLIRSRAKYEIATARTRNAQMAQAMSPDPPGASYKAWKTLKAEANRVYSRGYILPTPF